MYIGEIFEKQNIERKSFEYKGTHYSLLHEFDLLKWDHYSPCCSFHYVDSQIKIFDFSRIEENWIKKNSFEKFKLN